MTGFGIDLGAMNDAHKGITSTLGQLRELGYHGEEESGSPIEELGLDEETTGHEAISDRLDELLTRGHYALRELLDDGDDIAERLTETLRQYQHMEADAESGFEQLWNVFTDSVTMQSPRKGT